MEETLGPSIPYSIGKYIFRIFASKKVVDENAMKMSSLRGMEEKKETKFNYFMTFDDFIALYVCFRDKKDEEMLQVTFYMSKIRPDDYPRKPEPNHDLDLHSQHGHSCKGEEYFTRQDLQIVATLV